MSGGIRVDVIIPVHNAADDLCSCLGSLERNLPVWARLELVDDASTDPRIGQILDTFASGRPEQVSIFRQAHNLGFVATVNGAMARSRRDVVLLNSDTVVTEGWLDRLDACMRSDNTIASATPFSNNAEICSFPEFCRNNPIPDQPDLVARFMREVGVPGYPSLPTAVGFCVWLRRAALEQVGDFDQATFGHGYGEENDWCLRAQAHGWRHALCDDAYVVHRGGASFSALGLKPGGEQLRRLVSRYPHYNDLIANYIRTDPLASRRREISSAMAL